MDQFGNPIDPRHDPNFFITPTAMVVERKWVDYGYNDYGTPTHRANRERSIKDLLGRGIKEPYFDMFRRALRVAHDFQDTYYMWWDSAGVYRLMRESQARRHSGRFSVIYPNGTMIY